MSCAKVILFLSAFFVGNSVACHYDDIVVKLRWRTADNKSDEVSRHVEVSRNARVSNRKGPVVDHRPKSGQDFSEEDSRDTEDTCMYHGERMQNFEKVEGCGDPGAERSFGVYESSEEDACCDCTCIAGQVLRTCSKTCYATLKCPNCFCRGEHCEKKKVCCSDVRRLYEKEWRACKPSCICRRQDCNIDACCRLPSLNKTGRWSSNKNHDKNDKISDRNMMIEEISHRNKIANAREKEIRNRNMMIKETRGRLKIANARENEVREKNMKIEEMMKNKRIAKMEDKNRELKDMILERNRIKSSNKIKYEYFDDGDEADSQRAVDFMEAALDDK